MFALIKRESEIEIDEFELIAVSRSKKKLIALIPESAVADSHIKGRYNLPDDDWGRSFWYEINDVRVV